MSTLKTTNIQSSGSLDPQISLTSASVTIDSILKINDTIDFTSASIIGIGISINTKTTSYTLVLSDAGKTIEMNVGSANNLTIPPNSSVAFPTGTTIDVIQYGAGQTTIVAGSGVTLRSKEGNLKLTGQYSGATLYKRGTDEWLVIGDLTS